MGDTPLVRDWGRHPRRRRRRVPLPLAGAALALVLGAFWWTALRPEPWRPPSGRSFSSCTLAAGVSGWCADVPVAVDPLRARGPTVSLRVAVLPASTRPAKGAVFYLEGGPGLAATASAATVVEELGRIGRERDLVLVDQRGTGGSAPLACPAARVPAQRAAAVRSYVRRCFGALARTSRPALYTSAGAADDLEAVRRALGYGPIDLVGTSYGGTLAQVYAQRHPAGVRSLVLDGTSLLGVHLYEAAPRNAERALAAVFARCAAELRCRRAYPRLRTELARLLARPPRSVTVETGTARLTPDDIAWTVAALSRTADAASTLPYTIDSAARGDDAPLARAFLADVGTDLDPRARQAMFWEILCNEPWASFDPGATARADAGSYLAAAAVARSRLFSRVCTTVPRGRVQAGRQAPLASPVLLLAGGADPDDPPANLRGYRRVFPRGRLVVVPSAGHGTLGYDCVQLLVARFVAHGSAAGLDAGCVRRVPIPAFLIR